MTVAPMLESGPPLQMALPETVWSSGSMQEFSTCLLRCRSNRALGGRQVVESLTSSAGMVPRNGLARAEAGSGGARRLCASSHSQFSPCARPLALVKDTFKDVGGNGLPCSSVTAEILSEADLQSLCAAGQLGEVVDLLEEGKISASSDKVYARLMHTCGRLKALSLAKRVHTYLAGRGLESDSYLGSGIVEMYVKCGDFSDAERVHRKLPWGNSFSWTALISGYARCGKGREALKTYEGMREEGAEASTYTFVHVLKACSSLGDLETGKKIHFHIVQSGHEANTFVATMLLDMYAKCGSMTDAGSIFEKWHGHRSVLSWNVMILGYARNEMGEAALELYSRMRLECVTPDERTFVGALKACSSLATLEEGTEIHGKHVKIECLKKGRAIHAQVLMGGFESDLFVGTTLVDMYAKCGSMLDAHNVFDELAHHDVVSWNAMILGHAEGQEGELGMQLYAWMHLEGVTPNDRTFVGALMACGSLAASEEGREVGGKFVRVQSLEKGRAIHSRIEKGSFESNVFVGTALVDMYAKCGSMVDAHHVFENLHHRNAVSWNVMILGYAEQGENEEAFKLYAQMQKQGLQISSWTLVSILKACGNTAALETGKEIHTQICRAGIASDLVVAAALVDMYSKCGSMVDAQNVFDALPSRDLVTWTALIAGYARQGESELVFRSFERMRLEGIQPNGVTFLSVITLCSHKGLVDKGLEYLNAMRKDYGITPTIEHYNCVVDLLGRAGQIDEAVKMVQNMPFKPNLVTWLTLLGACQKWANLEVGRHAFEQAVRLDEDNAAAYILMSNISAGAQTWETCGKVEALRENAGAWKKPGQSWWTGNDGMVHAFVVGDKRHLRSKALYAKLKELSVKIEEGCESDLEVV